MKKFVTFVSMIALAISMAAMADVAPQIWGSQSKISAMRPAMQFKNTLRAEQEPQWETFLVEDFSKMTAGADDAPDANDLCGDEYAYQGCFPLAEGYTMTPGWTGQFVYQAGGAVAIGYPGYGGALSSPDGDYSGHIRISYRAKAVGNRITSWAVVGKGSSSAPTGQTMGGMMIMMNLKPEDGWQEYSEEMYVPNYLGFVQFNVVYSQGQLVIDDFKVERDLNYVTAPVILKATDFTDTGFTASWDPVGLAESYRVQVLDIDGNVVATVETDETSAVITGLDMAGEYCFDVIAVGAGGIESEPSEPCWAFGLPSPHVDDATDISDRGAFTANWQETPRATNYQVNIYKITVPDTDEPDKVIIDENFFKCTYGSSDLSDVVLVGSPVEDMQLDEFTDNPGWIGRGTVLAGDNIGCYVPYPGEDLHLTTPMLCLNNNGGKFKVDLTYMAGTDAKLYVKAGDEQQMLTVDDPYSYDRYDATLDFNSGTASTRIRFYGDNTDFLVDRMTVMQDAIAGEPFYSFEAIGETDDINYRVTGLDTEEATQYAYNVIAMYQAADGIWYSSNPSDLVLVDLEKHTAISEISTDDDLTVQYFDMQGRQVAVPQSGIYIKRTGNDVTKVLVK